MFAIGVGKYGRVDRVPGLFHVSSNFLYFNWLPLVPLGSVLVPEKDATRLGLKEQAVGLSGRSILAGYTRFYMRLAFVGVGSVAARSWLHFWFNGRVVDRLDTWVVVWLALGLWIVTQAARAYFNRWLLATALLSVMVAGLAWQAMDEMKQDPKLQQRARYIQLFRLSGWGAVGLLLFLGAVDRFNHPSPFRAAELAESLGIPAALRTHHGIRDLDEFDDDKQTDADRESTGFDNLPRTDPEPVDWRER